MHAELDVVSSWIAHYAGLLKPGAKVIDLACGGGRHARYLADQGHTVLAVDRDPDSLAFFVASALKPPTSRGVFLVPH